MRKVPFELCLIIAAALVPGAMNEDYVMSSHLF